MFYEGCTKEELEAYRNLEGEAFDFGDGLIVPDGSCGFGSEDAYLEMDLQLYSEMEDFEYYETSGKRINKHVEEFEIKTDMIHGFISKRKTRRRNKIKDKRKSYYSSGRKKYLKNLSNRVLRNREFNTNGSSYKHLVDSWMIL